VYLMRIRTATCLCVVLACGGPSQADVPRELREGQQGQPKAAGRAAQPTEPRKPMKIGGEVSAPKPTSGLNIKWPGNPKSVLSAWCCRFRGCSR
jgi:hypothetical protein